MFFLLFFLFIYYSISLQWRQQFCKKFTKKQKRAQAVDGGKVTEILKIFVFKFQYTVAPKHAETQAE